MLAFGGRELRVFEDRGCSRGKVPGGVARGDKGGLLGTTTVSGRAGPRGSGLLPCELAEGFRGHTASCAAEGAGKPGPGTASSPRSPSHQAPPHLSYLEKSDLKRPLPPAPHPQIFLDHPPRLGAW